MVYLLRTKKSKFLRFIKLLKFMIKIKKVDKTIIQIID